MARSSFNQIQSAPMRRRPMSPFVPLAIVIVVLVGLLFFLSQYAKLQPVQQVEVDVARDSAAH